MLDMPRRSVTRFFIPLIDVLTLLFCVFLVMPMAKGTMQSAESSEEEEIKRLRAEVERLKSLGAEEPERIRKELEELRSAKAAVLKDRIVPRILEIDGNNGKLYYQGAKGRVELTGPESVRDLIEMDRRRLGDKSEVVYILQYPRDANSDYPTLADEERFKTWLKDVPLRSDAPWEKGP